jgi:thioredoxin reductase (NADPH)
VAVVGGAKSAGQAAAFLSRTVSRVHMLVRSAELSSTMSGYLIQRLTENSGIDLDSNTEIVQLDGDSELERIVWQDRSSGELSTRNIHFFIMAGASRRTEWLCKAIALDDKGLVLTGRDLDAITRQSWPPWQGIPRCSRPVCPAYSQSVMCQPVTSKALRPQWRKCISIHLVHRALAEL